MKDKRPGEEDFSQAKAWDLPYVEDAAQRRKDEKTNALNRRSDWKYEPPEEEEEFHPPTLQEIEAIRQAAYEEGYTEGKQKGYEDGKAQGFEEGKEAGHREGLTAGTEEGLSQGKEQIENQISEWQQLTEKLHAPLAQVNDEIRQQLARLAVTLARSVIKTEISTNENVILQALAEGLKVLPIQENQYQIQMHPEDIALVTDHFGEDTVREKKWNFVETPGMERGGCDIVTSQNAVDVSTERRCKDILDKFLMEQGLRDD
ncbi:flagellar assembly protein FliH [Alteromonas pelagimontana]|uniref:Flagellar assembly protein FliH n=1 Tax=Alteromonas pelagimontana TaxID=1858656 RepID=A0A6M4MFX5_9ALTE|nr:flagellar assembly protein FliH [Alteromonas pelagimontana]QJR81857.1 flagellar assembly protein FliH [Alteromonas pelagimontana]